MDRLKLTQPGLDITERDVNCVKLAGLCHDLGHGFSFFLFSFFFNNTSTHQKILPENRSICLPRTLRKPRYTVRRQCPVNEEKKQLY
jgi:hypothetical protein